MSLIDAYTGGIDARKFLTQFRHPGPGKGARDVLDHRSLCPFFLMRPTSKRRRVLMICGSINQTTQMHAIARELPDFYDIRFSPYYGSFDSKIVRELRFLEGTIGGHKLRKVCLSYLEKHDLPVDLDGENAPYDLVFTCSDLLVPAHHKGTPMVLVQEGMTDDPNFMFPLVRRFPNRLPRWIAGTAATGLSGAYDRFCVASEGYRDMFVGRGAPADKVRITGIPNFDNAAALSSTEFPHRDYVLVCTSDIREVFGFENRRATIERAKEIAAGRPLIFKLHPNEKKDRAVREIKRWAPEARVFTEGSVEPMIAHCEALVTRFSSVVFVGLALEKEVYSDFPMERLKQLQPIQNGGTSARRIAEVAVELLGDCSEVSCDKPMPCSTTTRSRDDARGTKRGSSERAA